MVNTTAYTTGEVANLLGVTSTTVLYWCRAGRIKAYRTSPIGHWRIMRETVVEYARENGIPLREEKDQNE